MYFVDRNQISKALEHMEELLKLFRSEEDWEADMTHTLALARLTHVMIESIIDVGNNMIDGFIMRDPGSYEDIIDILEDEKVISLSMSEPLKQVVELRKMIVRDFVQVDHTHIVQTLNNSMNALVEFPGKVRHYVEHELGPVSAFIPEDDSK